MSYLAPEANRIGDVFMSCFVSFVCKRSDYTPLIHSATAAQSVQMEADALYERRGWLGLNGSRLAFFPRWALEPAPVPVHSLWIYPSLSPFTFWSHLPLQFGSRSFVCFCFVEKGLDQINRFLLACNQRKEGEKMGAYPCPYPCPCPCPYTYPCICVLLTMAGGESVLRDHVHFPQRRVR